MCGQNWHPNWHRTGDVDRIEALHRVIGIVPAGSDIAVPVDKFIADAAAA